jgi:phosphatidylserine decarboxylase
MSDKISITYYDRTKGALDTEHVYASNFLYWLYNTTPGWFVMDLILRQKFVSKIYGWFQKQPPSRWEIKSFAKKMNVNLDDLVHHLEDFKSFNDFFTHEIDLSKRPINTDPHVCIAPVDGKILAYSIIEPQTTFRIKQSVFNLSEFLRNDELTEKFAKGSMIISRLCLTDYHHFHFPDSGIPGEAISIRGKCYAGGPYALRRIVPFYTENYRMLTLLDSDHFGQMVLVEIGAFTVGSIQQRYQPGVNVAKGARKGFFELGGSTIVLLFQGGVIELDEDLLTNTTKEIETYVRLGDSIGKAPR